MAVSIKQRTYETRKTFKAYGFDWSGTISDDLVAAYTAAAILAKEVGFEIEKDPLTWARHPASTPDAELLMKQAEKNAPKSILEMTPEKYKARFAEIYGNLLREESSLKPKPIPHVVESIKRLKETHPNSVYFIVSACPSKELAVDVKSYGLDEVFGDRVYGSVSDKSKVMEHIMQETGIEPSDVIYIGDTAGDIKAGKKAKVTTVAVEGYHSLEDLAQLNPDYTFNTLDIFINYMLGVMIPK
jgi:phosphoglycolate phosphatase-like HAD superfamily hydrolase